MGFMDDFAEQVAKVTIGVLPEAATQRLAALFAVKGALPAETDIYDRIRASRYVLTGFEDPPEVDQVRTASGAVVAVISREDRVSAEAYPYPSGDATVLGPEIFASTPTPQDHTVINWRGQNFYTRLPEPEAVADHPDDPGPEEPSGELPDLGQAEPAPSAGTHWQGHRGP